MILIKKSMNKKANSIPIIILLVCTLALSILSLSFFLVKQNDIKEVFRASVEIDKLNLEKLYLDFYLEDIFEKAVRSYDSGNGERGLLESFRKELKSYLGSDGKYPVRGLAGVDLLTSKPEAASLVSIDGNQISMRITADISRYDSADRLDLIYDYDRTFRSFKLLQITQ